MTQDIKTIAEVQAEIDKLPAMMAEKGIVAPVAYFQIQANVPPFISLMCSILEKQFDGGYHKRFSGNSITEALTKARVYIATLPDPDEAAQHAYMKKVTETIDYGHDNGIADEYVAPLRNVKTAMTENLLTKEGA